MPHQLHGTLPVPRKAEDPANTAKVNPLYQSAVSDPVSDGVWADTHTTGEFFDADHRKFIRFLGGYVGSCLPHQKTLRVRFSYVPVAIRISFSDFYVAIS